MAPRPTSTAGPSTKERILAAALDLFSQRGYTAVSVRDLARAVGIKESSLYNHFSSKEEILTTIYANFRAGLQSSLPPVAALDRLLEKYDPETFLQQGFQLFQQNVSNPAIMQAWRIVHMEQYRDPVAQEILLTEIYGRTVSFLEEVFRRLIAAGRVRPFDPQLLAVEYQYPVFALMTEYAIRLTDEQGLAEVEQRVQAHIAFFISLVRS